MMQSGAVEKEKSSYARGPGFDSRPWNLFPFLGRFVLLRFFFQLFFLPFDWFQFIHSDAPLQLHNVLRLTSFYIFVQGMIRE